MPSSRPRTAAGTSGLEAVFDSGLDAAGKLDSPVFQYHLQLRLLPLIDHTCEASATCEGPYESWISWEQAN